MGLRRRLAKWLLRELLDEGFQVGKDPLALRPTYVQFPPLTADPALAEGMIWLRGDLDRLRYSGDGSTVISLDPSLTAADVWSYATRTLTTPVGIVPDDAILLDNPTERQITASSYTKYKEIQLVKAGKIRTYFELRATNASYGVVGQVYKNGTGVGTTRQTYSLSYVAFTEDIAFAVNDLYQIYCYDLNTAYPGYVRNQRVNGKDGIGVANPSY